MASAEIAPSVERWRHEGHLLPTTASLLQQNGFATSDDLTCLDEDTLSFLGLPSDEELKVGQLLRELQHDYHQREETRKYHGVVWDALEDNGDDTEHLIEPIDPYTESISTPIDAQQIPGITAKTLDSLRSCGLTAAEQIITSLGYLAPSIGQHQSTILLQASLSALENNDPTAFNNERSLHDDADSCEGNSRVQGTADTVADNHAPPEQTVLDLNHFEGVSQHTKEVLSRNDVTTVKQLLDVCTENLLENQISNSQIRLLQEICTAYLIGEEVSASPQVPEKQQAEWEGINLGSYGSSFDCPCTDRLTFTNRGHMTHICWVCHKETKEPLFHIVCHECFCLVPEEAIENNVCHLCLAKEFQQSEFSEWEHPVETQKKGEVDWEAQHVASLADVEGRVIKCEAEQPVVTATPQPANRSHGRRKGNWLSVLAKGFAGFVGFCRKAKDFIGKKLKSFMGSVLQPGLDFCGSAMTVFQEVSEVQRRYRAGEMMKQEAADVIHGILGSLWSSGLELAAKAIPIPWISMIVRAVGKFGGPLVTKLITRHLL